MAKKETKVIYLKALFKKHKGTQRLDKLIKHFIIMNKGFIVVRDCIKLHIAWQAFDLCSNSLSILIESVDLFRGYLKADTW